MTTICIANHKGGVGKTTTAVTLATGLADLGQYVVLVDCDSQGNVAQFLDLESRPALYELVIQEKPPRTLIQEPAGYPLLSVVTGNQDTLEIEDALNRGRRLTPAAALREALRPFREASWPPVIILDTAPSLSALQVSALSGADWLIVPAAPEFASETGVSALVQAVADLQQAGSKLDLLGILPTMVDRRSNEHKQGLADLEAAYPDFVLPAVRRLIAIAEAPREGKPIWAYNGQAAEDYGLVLAEVKRRVGL